MSEGLFDCLTASRALMADLPSNAHARRRPNVERDLFTLHVRYGDFTGTTTAENFSLRPRPDGTSTRNITFTHEEIARGALPPSQL